MCWQMKEIYQIILEVTSRKNQMGHSNYVLSYDARTMFYPMTCKHTKQQFKTIYTIIVSKNERLSFFVNPNPNPTLTLTLTLNLTEP